MRMHTTLPLLQIHILSVESRSMLRSEGLEPTPTAATMSSGVACEVAGGEMKVAQGVKAEVAIPMMAIAEGSCLVEGVVT